jgi:hypothetical protein
LTQDATLPPERSEAVDPPERTGILRDMAGTTGKFPGESEISSMGTNNPPFIEEPVRLSDWLVSDGAQVTRPSIDPYREEIEISAFIGGPGMRLSSPFFFTHLPAKVPADLLKAFTKTAVGMGLLFDIDTMAADSVADYSGRLITDIESDVRSSLKSARLERFMSGELAAPMARERAKGGVTLLLRAPASRGAIATIIRNLDALAAFAAILLDEDEPNSDVQLEAAVSLLDRELKQRGMRGRFNIIAEGNGVRGSDDVFKIVALGADCVGLGRSALLAIGAGEGDAEIVLDSRISQRLENFVSAAQKDIKLLAGAAGISNISSTLTGNRELSRSVDLDSVTRTELGVKPAGVA